MCVSKKICPVPFDQQPLNEYFSLRTSWFFSWSTLTLNKYLIKIFNIFILLFIALIPLVLSIISSKISLYKLLFLNIFVITLIFLLIFIRLYLGWSYVAKRLISATVFYEESGWYDGQLWVKSSEVLIKDRLIVFYEVIPFLRRVKYSIFISLILLLIEKLIYSLIL
uniref:Ycf36 n=1 Tax=Gracilariopsis longissima TaxID=172976 RepID=A0A345U9L7_9FLOR|nr:hypothetical protein [Gracilariopsis longissima]AXI97153.1 hypothetical protein [Gracilariopsis longissima]UAD89069.1 hypothetical protein [Gracilariopsis longissima]